MQFSTASQPGSQKIIQRPLVIILGISFLAFWIACFAGTTDLSNWYVENMLVVIFIPILIITGKKFLFSDLSYCFLFLFLVLHVYGAKYAYADNPLGYWLQAQFHTTRNNYDRIVHTSFGLLLSYPLREFLMRRLKVKEVWGRVLAVEIILSLSAAFELVEWSIADVFFPKLGTNYVGTQGDAWDAQKDIFVATCGAIVAMSLLSAIKKVLAQERKTELQSPLLQGFSKRSA